MYSVVLGVLFKQFIPPLPTWHVLAVVAQLLAGDGAAKGG